MATLNTVFKKIYGEALEHRGFVKLNGKQLYYVRLIGDEILHIVSYANDKTGRSDDKAFSVRGGIATVYRRHLHLETPPLTNINWLHGNFTLYTRSNPFDFDPEFRESIYSFHYDEYDVFGVVEHSLEITEEIMLPILDKVTDLKLCMEYYSVFGPSSCLVHDYETFGNRYDCFSEGLFCLKLGGYGKYKENKIQEFLKKYAYGLKIGAEGYTQEEYEKQCKMVKDETPKRMAKYYEIFSNREWCDGALAELERRKLTNTEILRSYGLSI